MVSKRKFLVLNLGGFVIKYNFVLFVIIWIIIFLKYRYK